MVKTWFVIFQDFVHKKKPYANYDKTYLDVKRRGDTYKRIDPKSKNIFSC